MMSHNIKAMVYLPPSQQISSCIYLSVGPKDQLQIGITGDVRIWNLSCSLEDLL